MWVNVCVFAFKMYAIICVPLNTPTFFYLHHHGAASCGWKIGFPMRCVFKRNLDLYWDHSYATVPIHAREDVMCTYASLHHSEVWLSIQYSILLAIYPNSWWLAEAYITIIFMLWNWILFPSIGWFCLHITNFNVLLCERMVVKSVKDFTMITSSHLNTTCPHFMRNIVLPKKRLSWHYVMKKIYGGVIFATHAYSKQQTVCSFNSIRRIKVSRLFRTKYIHIMVYATDTYSYKLFQNWVCVLK